MSLVEPPSRKSGDDLDDLLRMYFRRQMPQPWPAFPSPNPLPLWGERAKVRGTPSGRSLMRSRWALAASIGLLLLSSLLLPRRLTPGNKSEDVLDGPLLNDNGIRRQMEKEHQRKEFENKNKPALGVQDDDPLRDLDESDMLSIK